MENKQVTMEVMLANAEHLAAWFAARHRMGAGARTSDERKRKICVAEGTIEALMGGGYAVAPGGIAVILCSGPMYKGYGSLGYADQTEIRAAVRMAAGDPHIAGIMLLIDSPGGSVAGTQDLVEEINAADKVKPVYAYIEDTGCSAAYWVAAAARQIFANPMAWVGSIGVITALIDASKMYEQWGIKVFPIVTGKFKAVGDASQPVTDEHLKYIQDRVDQMFDVFAGSVSKLRKMSVEKVKGLEAAVFMGEAAIEKKLVDQVDTFERAMTALAKESKQSGSSAGKRARALTQLDEMDS